MKKSLLYLALLLSVSTSLYPLTNQDWNVIRTIITSSTTLGAFGGAAFGGIAGIAAGNYLAPMPTATITSRAQWQAYLVEVVEKSKQRQKTRLLTKIVGAAGGGAAGVYFGNALAKRLAINYIARKYGVDRATAWNAIQNNLDISQQIKGVN